MAIGSRWNLKNGSLKQMERSVSLEVLDILVENGQGTLYCCPECKQYYYFNALAFGGGRFHLYPPFDKKGICP